MVHDDPSDLGAALTDALLDRAMPARMGLAARALAESGYTPSHCAAQYLSLVMGQQSCLTARTHALGQNSSYLIVVVPAAVTTCGVVARSRGGLRETAPARLKSRYTPATRRKTRSDSEILL
ncbi:hypothetical protein GCM10023323_22500 [Streptomyces thinghirensis]|uniref:Uncharacterized protein n=1 Tax=Streptomyces thinghirensis TaxID=551547 RepID=A0ABP9T0W0_9ACTN